MSKITVEFEEYGDAELTAIGGCLELLNRLSDPSARMRVLLYLDGRFRLEMESKSTIVHIQ